MYRSPVFGSAQSLIQITEVACVDTENRLKAYENTFGSGFGGNQTDRKIRRRNKVEIIKALLNYPGDSFIFLC